MRIVLLSPNDIPTTTQMIHLHEVNGSQLTRDAEFGSDPLGDNHALKVLQQHDFCSQFPNSNIVFQVIIRNRGEVFRKCVSIYITYQQICITCIAVITLLSVSIFVFTNTPCTLLLVSVVICAHR